MMMSAAHEYKTTINKDPEVVNQERTEHATNGRWSGPSTENDNSVVDKGGRNDPSHKFLRSDGWRLAMRQIRRIEPARDEGSLKRGN